MAILSGCVYLKDISHGPHPIEHDKTVAQAWGQPAWADHSGVSRTMKACTDNTVEAVRDSIAAFTRPFIDREVVLALQKKGYLVYDGDLTGRPVSSNSTTFPGAVFGWMDGFVKLGYQAALVSMHSPTYGRMWLSVTPHPGDVISSTQAEALVIAAEARTGTRPFRRTDLLARRIEQKREQVRKANDLLQSRRNRYEELLAQSRMVSSEWRQWRDEVVRLEQYYQAKGLTERPYSHLAKARKKMDVRHQRIRRRARDLRRVRQLIQQQAERVQEIQEELDVLEVRHTRFVEDNCTNRAPIRAIFRLDAGFGTWENIALLVEMGYDVYTKAFSHQVTSMMRGQVTAETGWVQVGRNAHMTAWADLPLDSSAYPLDVALERFRRGEEDRYAVLVHYGEDEVADDLPGWFHFYNSRQTIEAGVKEGKHVFHMNHFKVRGPEGRAIQEEFTALAANLVRWAARWLYEQSSQAEPPFDQPQIPVKQMVRVAANTSALVIWHPEGHLLLRFDELSPYPGIELRFGQGWAFQRPLPLFKNDDFGPV